ncbi:phosphotriesterase family protein [Geodermatophilus sp. SYSU D00815]
MSARVRTVLGDVEPAALGPTDYHEHLFQVSPLLRGDELDDEAASGREAELLRAAGAGAVVEATPTGLGRRPDAVARISARTGLAVVHVTGAHREAHYAPGDPLLEETAEALESRFAADLFDGMDGTAVRAGAVKAGAGYWALTAFERRVLTAAGRLAGRTGAPVMVHLEHGSAGHEVLDLLAAEGCPADRVALAHVDRNPDPVLHGELAARGAYLGYDGAARHQRWPDSVLVQCLAAVVGRGGGERVLLGGDVARRTRYVAYGGMPGLAYLFDRFVPRLRDALGAAAVETLLVANPARWLGWEPAR